MKTENEFYKFDIQLFAGETITLGSTTTEPAVYEQYAEDIQDAYTYAKLYLVSYDSSSATFAAFVTANIPLNWGPRAYISPSTLSDEFSINSWYSITLSGLTPGTEYSVGAGAEDEDYVISNASITFTTLSAGWTVSFDSNGGTAVSDIEDVEDGATISAPTAPTRTNYTFAGWFTDDGTFADQWVFASDTVTEDITLYAKWVQNAFDKLQEFGRQTIERVDGKASKHPPTNTQDANYTLVLADDGKVILAGHATNAVKITIPLNSSVEFPVDTEIAIVKYLAGDVTIGTASGATLNGEASTTTFEITDQYGTVAIKKVGTDAWIMTGGFEEVA